MMMLLSRIEKSKLTVYLFLMSQQFILRIIVIALSNNLVKYLSLNATMVSSTKNKVNIFSLEIYGKSFIKIKNKTGHKIVHCGTVSDRDI